MSCQIRFVRRALAAWPSPYRRSPRFLRVTAGLLVVVLAATAVAGQALATTALRVKITTRPPAYSASTSALFKWKTTGARSTSCSLDGKRFRRCKSSKRVKSLRDGKHSFRVKAVSRTGKKTVTATVSWRVDTTAPTAPNVSGGSSTWQNVASIPISASGSTDTGGSGVAGYQSRVSTDGGTTWSAPVSGALVAPTADLETLVEFRAVDRAGNVSAWSPAPGDPAGTAAIDRDAPAAPNVTGGSLQWQNTATVDVVAAGGADVGGAGLAYYQYRTSTDGGTTWSAPTVGSDAPVSADGETLVQFQGVDAAGNASAWAPASPDDGSTVRLDRTLPTNPVVTGGTAGWQNIASTLVSASGSTDGTGGSGIAYYQYRTSTDGGTTWSVPAVGTSVTVSAEGETLVQFQSVDNSNLDSAWITSPVQIDRTNPTDPTVSGGSSAWQSVPSITIGAALSTDSGGSGLAGYQFRTSTDGGVTWSGATAGSSDIVNSEGETLVQFRAIDGAGNTSNWVQDTARIDRSLPTDPNVTGGSLSWQSVPSVDVTASGSTDTGGSTLSGYQYRTSTNGGATWSGPVAGAVATVSAQGTTLVQFQAVDGAGNTSAWAPATAGANNTVKLDQTAPTLSGVSGGSLTWKSSASVTITAGSASDTGGSGFSHDEYRTSTDGGTTWSAPTSGNTDSVSAEGETLVQFRSVDNAGNTSAWVPASPGASDTVRLDRTNPTAPSVSGGSSSWQNVPSILLSASGSTDLGSGVAGYEYRTSTNGGATWSAPAPGSSVPISNQGATEVGFRSVDNVGKTSAWVVANANIDRTAPSAPNVTGGSSAWQSVPSITVKAAGASDTGGSGLATPAYQYRTSTDGGATWSAPAAGSSLLVSAEGETLVQFESIDNAGNTSAWVQATARIDRTAPTTPNVSGGSASWQNAASVNVTASGSTDSGGSGFSYRYRTSTDGVTWSGPVAGASDNVSAQGTTYVQFQAIDGAGNTSAWAPAVNGAGNTVNLDRTAPTTPNVSGGSASWQNAASVNVTASGSTDSGGSGFSYRYRTSTDGVTWSGPVAGASDNVSAQGTTYVQFQAIDGAGNTSAWAPAVNGAGNTVKLDRMAPTAPTSVTGGSLSWKTSAVTITAAGGSDVGSGFKGYNVRTSTNGGTTWSAGAPIAGSTYQVTTDGTTLVQFQSVDNAGNVSAWTPASAGAGNTVKLDATAPSLPTVSGGFGAGTCKHRVTISASGSADATSGFAHYDYRVSSNNGATWGATVVGSSVSLTNAGTYIVQFNAVDNAGNISAWAPAAPTTGSTACVR